MKIKNYIKKVISLVLIGLILLPMTVKAEESQETETVILDERGTATASLNVGNQIYYSNLGWGTYLTNYFTTTVNGIERIAYCLEPGSLTPLPGDYDYEILSSNDNLLKSFYYGLPFDKKVNVGPLQVVFPKMEEKLILLEVSRTMSWLKLNEY